MPAPEPLATIEFPVKLLYVAAILPTAYTPPPSEKLALLLTLVRSLVKLPAV